MWLDRDPELVFQKSHYLEHSDGIKDSSRHQWRSVGQRRGIFSGQVFVKNECLHCSFDILWIHKDSQLASAGLVGLANWLRLLQT